MCNNSMMQKLLAVIFLSTPIASPVLAQSAAEVREAVELPKIVLVGDSIRLSYAPVVEKQLQGAATVIGPKANGGDSNNVVKHMEQWVIREQPNVVHLNCGIHDTKKFTATGKFQVSPEQYEANLRKIVESIRSNTDAVVIFATTTPILDERAAAARQGRDYELLEDSVEQYNAIARRVMLDLKVPVNDLHAVVAHPSKPLTTETLISNDGVHLTRPAKELVGKQVAAFVSEHIDRP